MNEPITLKPAEKNVPIKKPKAAPKKNRKPRVIRPEMAAFNAKQKAEREQFHVSLASKAIREDIERKWLPRLTKQDKEKLLDALLNTVTPPLMSGLPPTPPVNADLKPAPAP
jgi:hypothetical protein